ELQAIKVELDARCFELYGIDEADRRAILEGIGDGSAEAGAPGETEAGTAGESNDEGDAASSVGAAALAAELLSWAVGVAFGRFDVRLATGTRALAPEPGPFDPLPVCSPAMLSGED